MMMRRDCESCGKPKDLKLPPEARLCESCTRRRKAREADGRRRHVERCTVKPTWLRSQNKGG